MSLIARLMGGSSLIAAAAVGVISAPQDAAAQTVSCVPPAATGDGAAAATIAAGTYDPGLGCVYVGAGATVTTSGVITVSPTTSSPALNGVNLSATGASSITWNSTAGTVTGGAQTNGPIIEALAESGAINITTGSVTSSGNTATDGIRAVSGVNGGVGGDVTVNVPGTGSFVSVSGSTAGRAGIEAISLGGNGNVRVTSTNTGNTAINGRLYGIRAQASGTGTVTIEHAGGIRANASNADAVALDIVAGTGKVTVNSNGIGATLGSPIETFPFVGTALRAVYAGDAEFNLNTVLAQGDPTGTNWIADLSTAADTTTVINVAGILGGSPSSATVRHYTRTLRVSGAGDVDLNVAGRLSGFVDLTGGGQIDLALENGGQWRMNATSNFGAAADTLSTDADSAVLVVGQSAGSSTIPDELDVITLNFGAGDDVYSNGGLLAIGATWVQQQAFAVDSGEFEFRILGLESFENSGTILLGAQGSYLSAGTDTRPDDILYMSGTTFTGSGDSLIAFDVNLNEAQSSCDGALRSTVTLDMPAADCVRIENGATAGVTGVRVRELVPGDRGSYGEIVLVDVSGGTSGAGHFVLDPSSDNYDPANGGVIDKGMFMFPLVYDAETQQHKLVAAPGQNALQFPVMAQAAHGLWRLSTGSWLDRQADLRGGLEEGVGGGVWMRLATEFADRDVLQTVDVAGNPYSFDNTHEQSSYAVTGGLDVMTGSAGDSAWVLGVTAGYAHSELAFDASPNEMRLDGWTGGGYASFISGGLFVDAAVNTNKLELEGDIPGLRLSPATAMVATNLLSVGGQIEAGWRFPFMDGAFVEPLAGVSYVRTKYDDLSIAADDPLRPRLSLEFDDPASLRASVGARAGLAQDYGSVRAQYSLLGRVWEEFEDETALVIHNTGADAPVVDEFTGTFTEFGFGASLYAMDGVISGFLNLGGKFGDDYEAKSASAGVRVAW